VNGAGRGRRPARTAGRLAALFLLGSVLLVAAAPPAGAHVRAREASNFDSRILETPDIEGVEWRVYAGGALVGVTNHGDAELVVLGYEGEPFLRVGPGGVFENRNSPATYLNADRYGDVAVPPRADPAAAPQWAQVSRGPTATWHDHRMHWMSDRLPATVRAGRDRRQLVQPWTLPALHEGREVELVGELWWVPAAPAWPWLLAALALTLPILAGVRVRHRGRAALLRPAAAGVAAIALLNTLHFVDELRAWPSPTLDVLFGLFHTALFVGAGLVGAALAWRAVEGPLLSLGIASGAVLFHQGLLQLPLLSASQLPTVWPPIVLRIAVALSVAQAVWVAVVIGTGLRAEHATPPHSPAGDAGAAALARRPRVATREL
jgi:hypothetical protein